MKDELIYCSDLTALKIQLKDDGFYDEESGSYTVNHTLVPLKYNGNKSLSYVRNCVLDLNEYIMLESLGSYDECFGNIEKDNKYKSVYPYDVPIKYADKDGVEQEYMRPKKIGVFAWVRNIEVPI